MLKQSEKLFQVWNDNNLRYFHWKSNEHLQEGLDGMTDVDVYVHPDDKKQAQRINAETGYIKVIPRAGGRYPDVEEWIGFDYDTGSLIHIHLHYAMISGKKYVKEYVIPWHELGLASRIKDEETNVYIASPDLEIIILYTRMALKTLYGEKVEIKKEYDVEIEYLKKRINPDRMREFCMAVYPNKWEHIVRIIEKDSPTAEELAILKAYVEAELQPYIKMPKPLVLLRHYYYKNSIKVKRVMSKRTGSVVIDRKTAGIPGISICFIGADGSGKSTISDDIVKWLNWKIESRRFYLGSGDHYKSLFKKINKKASKAASESKVVAAGVRNEKSALKYMFDVIHAREFVKIAKRACKQLERSEKYRDNGGIAVFDRYPQIQFQGINDGPKIESRYAQYGDRWPFRILAKKERLLLEKAVGYKPTIVIKLLISPEESIKRKPDSRYSYIKRKTELIGEQKFEGAATYRIDAEQPYDKELLEVKRIVWEAIKNHS